MKKRKLVAAMLALVFVLVTGCSDAISTEKANQINVNDELQCEELEFSEPLSGFSCIRWVNNSIRFKAQTTDGKTYICSSTAEGEIENKISLEFLEINGLLGTTFAYGENEVWVAAQKSVVDESQQEIGLDSYLFQMDDLGNIKQEVALNEAYPDIGEFETVSSVAIVENGVLVMLDMELLYISSETGQVLDQLHANSYLSNFVTDVSQNLYCRDYNGALMPVMLEPLRLGTIVYEGANLSVGTAEYDILMSGEEALYGVEIENGKQNCLFHWSDCYITDGTASAIHLQDDGDVLFYYFDSIVHSLKICKATWRQSASARETLCLFVDAEYDLDTRIYEAINTFNRTNQEYVIEIEAYPSDEELYKVVISGDAPDLFYLGNSSEQELINRGILTDLYTLIGRDTEFHQEDLLTAYRVAHEYNGALYSLNSFFSIITLAGRTELVGEEAGWTLDEFYDVVSSMPEEMTIFSGFNNESALLEILSATLGNFVDAENQTCSFESENFIGLLKTIHSRYTDEAAICGELGLLQGQCLLEFAAYTGANVSPMEEYQGAAITMVGFPGVPGSGAVMRYADGAFWGIYDGSSHKDAAWSFLKTLLSADYESEYMRGFPITEESFALCINERIESGDLTESAAEQLQNIIETTTVTSSYSSSIIDIVMEEIPYYFNDEKTAEEVAEVIQNRVEIYMAE